MPQARRRKRAVRGFTLVELLGVIALAAALSCLAIPALGAMTRARQSAAAGEVARLLTLARQRAITTGAPTGVVVNLASETLTMVSVATDSGSPTPVLNPASGGAYEVGSASIEAFQRADGTVGSGAIWFHLDGAPVLRSANGEFAPAAGDAVLQFDGGFTITVRRVTGAIER